eukprot:s119_g77.t1
MQDSNERLGVGDAWRLRYATVQGSHTNMVFRAIYFGPKHEDMDMTINGRLSTQKEVITEFPEWPRLQQATGNAIGQVAKHENELQVAKKAKRALSNKDLLQKAKRAEEIILKFSGLVGHEAGAIGALSVQLAAILLEKKKVKQYESIEEAAFHALRDLGLESKALPSWEKAHQDAEADKASKAASTVPQLNESGNVANNAKLAATAGFKVGVTLVRKSDEIEGVINAIGNSETFLMVQGALKSVSTDSFINDEWKVQNASAVQETIALADCYEVRAAMIKSNVLARMHAQMKSKQAEDLVEAFKLPKEITAIKKFATHKLHLGCCAPKIQFVEEGKAVTSATAICLGQADLAPHGKYDVDDTEHVEPASTAEPVPEPEERPVHIRQVFAVSGGGLSLAHGKGSPQWLPEVVSINGMEFIKLSKWCPMLTRFCTGKSKLMRKKAKATHTINVAWFEEMAELRKQACNQAWRDVMVANANGDDSAKPVKFRPAMQQDEFLVDRSVVLSVPRVDEETPARNVRVLWAAKGTDIHIELTTANLEYVRRAIMASEPAEKNRRRSWPGIRQRKVGADFGGDHLTLRRKSCQMEMELQLQRLQIHQNHLGRIPEWV